MTTDIAKTNALGQHDGVTYDDANARLSAINAKETAALVLGGVGVAAVGVGTWLWLRAPNANVTLAPGPGTFGLSLAWRQ